MGLWARLANRFRPTGMDAGGGLHVCRECSEPFVYPTTWAESGPDRWWILLRCGACGTWRDVVALNGDVDDFDRELDIAVSAMEAEADRLERELLAEEADAFGKAMELDLLTADDFSANR